MQLLERSFAATAVGCGTIAELARPVTTTFLHITVPPGVMQCFQIFAWTCAGLAALVTVLSYFGIRPKRKKKDSDDKN